MTNKYHDSVTNGLVEELLQTIYRYSDTMLVATAVGCLELAKMQLIAEQEDLDDD